MAQFLLGFILAVLIAGLAWKVGSLSRSGAYAAVLVGTVIFGLGGLPWSVLLLAFFMSSSALTRLFTKQKASLGEKFAKGGQRDLGQVLANGAVASLFAGLHFFYRETTWFWLAFAASLAAVNADTWSTELGLFSPKPPRMITTGRIVEKGTSGAISSLGTLAAIAGATLIGLLAGALTPWIPLIGNVWRIVIIVTVSGVVGALFDSFLGAAVQGIYYCPKCDKETERHPLHTCNTLTQHIRGWKWLNNDYVNIACAAMGVIFCSLLLVFLRAS